MSTYIAIAFGGAIGAVSRYWLYSAVQRLHDSGFPLGTFVVNVLGSFLIGVFFVLLAEKAQIAEQWRPIIVVGFLGGLTTFSTFSLDALLLFEQGHYNTALFYIISSIVLCLIAAFAGMQLTRVML
ncbi:fluoride efflux transporter CrcB [Gammaproteobacteria bacterium]|nr:fluoride efflux transporter CrcB [Pseudomonadales bacterium]MBT5720195.1 fluoride efflux transporter CrcB [Gammaproteobacteria bacterium]MBT6481415.1 fluoride efflux transporter CrcB [Gammaproteobacteria bacterium]MBT7227846.1 fluoride efflux transporter CrcB [Gammaproteobacteria bacterium]MDB3898414.1 fluoride efflux transporter CrcB [Gammaproteobacteria bacterium]